MEGMVQFRHQFVIHFLICKHLHIHSPNIVSKAMQKSSSCWKPSTEGEASHKPPNPALPCLPWRFLAFPEQTDTSFCAPNQWENGKYNLISVRFDKISLCASVGAAAGKANWCSYIYIHNIYIYMYVYIYKGKLMFTLNAPVMASPHDNIDTRA